MLSLLRGSACALLPIVLCSAPALAVNASAFIRGTVTNQGKPVANAQVTASGNNLTAKTKTDAAGRFAFPPLAVGTYDVEARTGDLSGLVRVDLGGGGADVAIALAKLTEIAHAIVSRTQSPAIHGSGSDVVLNGTELTRLPFNNSFTQMQLQMPGAAQGANGVVHINGDHGVINYMIDGVPLPQELNRDIGSEINLNDLSFVDLLEGAYPAQYGLRFGAVFNMATRAGTGPPGVDGYASFGSYTNAQSTFGYHAPLEGGGGFDVAFSGLSTTRGLDPPDWNSPHNDGKLRRPVRTLHAPGRRKRFYQRHVREQPQHVSDSQRRRLRRAGRHRRQRNSSGHVSGRQFHHALGNSGAISFGPAYNAARIQDSGDPVNDWIYGESLNLTPPPFGNNGSSTDCANAFELAPGNPSAFPTMCGVSLADTRTELNYIVQADYTQSFGRHNVAAGVSYDLSRILKYYAISLQPNNYLAPILTPGAPNAPATVVDDSPNLGNTYQSYLQDSWRMKSLGSRLRASLRFLHDQVDRLLAGLRRVQPAVEADPDLRPRVPASTRTSAGSSSRSHSKTSARRPRICSTCRCSRGSRSSTLSRSAIRSSSSAATSASEPATSASASGKRTPNDLIDDTQVGVTLLHQDINYELGRLSQEALNVRAAARPQRPGVRFVRARDLAQLRVRDAVARAVLRLRRRIHAGRSRPNLHASPVGY